MDNIFGHTDPNFSKVEEVFRRNFQDGWEHEGAAFAVYHRGKLVVDLQGGYSDSSSLAKWTEKTRTVIFSLTKAVGALCIAILVDRGYLRYEDKLSNFWPEYSQNGKEDTTVENVMNHQAGLPVFGEDFSLEDAKDPEKISKIIEKSTPLWRPGTKSGYHAITYGWLVDQIIRRVDPQKRGIGQFVREELSEKYNLDFFIGLPPEEEYTVSRLVPPSGFYTLREIWHQPKLFLVLLHMMISGALGLGYPQVWSYPSWVKLAGDKFTFNNPEVHFLEQIGGLGITKARDLAKLFSLMLKGEIISQKLVKQFYEPLLNEKDVVLNAPKVNGHGFWYESHPKKAGKWLFGHIGYGGSNIMMDPEEEIVIAYVSNGMKNGMGDLVRTYRLLRNAVFDSLEKFGKENVSNGSFKNSAAPMA